MNRFYTEAVIALSNIACDRQIEDITKIIIRTSVFSEAVFPLYFNPNTTVRLKFELAYAACNSLRYCNFEDVFALLSSGQYIKIIVDMLKLHNKDKIGSLTGIALEGVRNLFILCEK